jgi:hypothetical protein
MKILVPVAIGDAAVLASSLAEDDAPAWSSGPTYALGDQVVHAHRVWTSVQAGNNNKNPATDDGTWWVDAGPTNAWAMFDESPSTPTTADTSLSVTLRPGVGVSDVALVSAVGAQVRVQVIDSDDTTVLYDQTQALAGITEASFHSWFFRDRFVIDTDAVFAGLPRRLTGSIVVTITGAGTVSVGSLLLGVVHDIGETLAGASSDIKDYSSVNIDEFGAVDIVRRVRARENTFQALVARADLPRVRALREHISSRAVVVIGSNEASLRSSLLTYGLVTSMPFEVTGRAYSLVSLDVLGFA